MTEYEIKFNEWREEFSFPNIESPSAKQKAHNFVQMIASNQMDRPLYKHQQLAILHAIYAYEVAKDFNILFDIVTGGGKTVIMSAIVAYFWQVHEVQKFLILTPNTIVRERVKDDFDLKSPDYAYLNFPFFMNSDRDVPKKLASKVLRERIDGRSIIDANVIVANIHQVYEGKEALEILLSDNIVPKLVVFNDEAHNASAEQYREVLKLLDKKTVMRIDLTATPFRLDGQDLDTYPPVYSYQVQEATKDRIVKQTLVTRPDIDKVRLTYEEWDEQNNVVRRLDAEEMPWEEIEKTLKNSGAVRFVTAANARRQQLQIADSCMDYQRKCVPLDITGKPSYEPIMLVVALSQKDASEIKKTLLGDSFKYKEDEVLLVHSNQDERDNKAAFLMGRSSSEGLPPEDQELWKRAKKIKVVIGVGMLREGWDVRNISVICLFRKFSYKKKGDQIYTVYGPQIIGRGLRKINKGKQYIDHLFVVDHPAFSHNWLWEIMGSEIYERPVNPGDNIDEGIIEDLKEKNSIPDGENIEGEEPSDESKKSSEQLLKELLDSLPQTASIVPINEWQKYFTELDFLRGVISSAYQHITNIKTKKVGSANTAHEMPDDFLNTPDDINKTELQANKTNEEKIKEIVNELEYLPKQCLNLTYRQVTAPNLEKMRGAIQWLLKNKFEIESIGVIQNQSDEKIDKLYFGLPQIIAEFSDPALVMGIVEGEK